MAAQEQTQDVTTSKSEHETGKQKKHRNDSVTKVITFLQEALHLGFIQSRRVFTTCRLRGPFFLCSNHIHRLTIMEGPDHGFTDSFFDLWRLGPFAFESTLLTPFAWKRLQNSKQQSRPKEERQGKF